MKKVVRFTFIILLTLSTLSCQKKRDTYANDYEQAQVLMEEGKYDSVITLLEPSLVKTPKNHSMRLLLASAYAARAGIFIISFKDFAKNFLDSPAVETGERKDSALVSSINQVKAYIDKFNRIPLIQSEQQWNDVEHAVFVIESESDFSGGAAVYSGLLRLVSLRYQLFTRDNFFQVASCQVTANYLSSKLHFIQDKVSGVLNCFIRATPKEVEKQELQSHQMNLDTNFQSLYSWISQAQNLDELQITKIFPKCNP
jgi:hypothetical protein